jgi:hypothetical protein
MQEEAGCGVHSTRLRSTTACLDASYASPKLDLLRSPLADDPNPLTFFVDSGVLYFDVVRASQLIFKILEK